MCFQNHVYQIKRRHKYSTVKLQQQCYICSKKSCSSTRKWFHFTSSRTSAKSIFSKFTLVCLFANYLLIQVLHNLLLFINFMIFSFHRCFYKAKKVLHASRWKKKNTNTNKWSKKSRINKYGMILTAENLVLPNNLLHFPDLVLPHQQSKGRTQLSQVAVHFGSISSYSCVEFYRPKVRITSTVHDDCNVKNTLFSSYVGNISWSKVS